MGLSFAFANTEQTDPYAAAMGIFKSTPSSHKGKKITVDWDKSAGKMKPLHGVNNSPVKLNGDLPEFREAGIPFMRPHDTYGLFGGNVYIDIPNIFRNFDADPNDPKSYDFAFTDEYLKTIAKTNAKVFYRLGVTIENNHRIKAYNIYPPKDNLKWAQICAGIIRHYTQGWANGFKYDIQYWEIWNEPENKMMWRGTRQQFFDLYKTTAKYLKKEFPNIKIGGYAGCGFFEITRPIEVCPTKGLNILDWFNEFLEMASDKNDPAPLDFFSWHLYTDNPKELAVHAEYVRKNLDERGLKHVENINNEWNYTLGDQGKIRKNHIGASMCTATFCVMQQGSIDKAMYYDATPTRSYCGLYNFPEMTLTKTFFAFKAFNELYKLGEAVKCTDNKASEIYAIAAKNSASGDKAILATNYSPKPQRVAFKFKGEVKSVVLIDEDYTFTELNFLISENQYKDKLITMPAHSVILIKVK